MGLHEGGLEDVGEDGQVLVTGIGHAEFLEVSFIRLSVAAPRCASHSNNNKICGSNKMINGIVHLDNLL